MMDIICKLLGIVDITAAVLLIVFVPQSFSFLKFPAAAVLAFKGISSLFG